MSLRTSLLLFVDGRDLVRARRATTGMLLDAMIQIEVRKRRRDVLPLEKKVPQAQKD